MTTSRHEMRIARRRRCLWCENWRLSEKEVRRKNKLSGIRMKPHSRQGQAFQSFLAPGNYHPIFFAPIEKILASIIISHHEHRRSSAAVPPTPASRPEKISFALLSHGWEENHKTCSQLRSGGNIFFAPGKKRAAVRQFGVRKGVEKSSGNSIMIVE